MIIILWHKVKDVSQESYDQTLERLNRQTIQCSECKQIGLNINGYYYHSFKQSCYPYKIKILVTQLICPCCGKTHAILLCTMVPWSQISLQDTIRIVETKNSEETRQLLNDHDGLNEEDIKRTKRIFRKQWKERLAGYRIEIDKDLTMNCICCHKRQFMQNHCGCCFAITLDHIGYP